MVVVHRHRLAIDGDLAHVAMALIKVRVRHYLAVFHAAHQRKSIKDPPDQPAASVRILGDASREIVVVVPDLVIVARRTERLSELAASLVNVAVRPLVADLSTDEGIEAVAQVCSTEPVTMLVNNAGVAHYMALAELPADKARELLQVKVAANVRRRRCPCRPAWARTWRSRMRSGC